MKKYIKIFIVLLFIILSTSFANADITVVQNIEKTIITKTGITFFVNLNSNELTTYTLKSDLGYEPVGILPFTPFDSTPAFGVKHGDSIEQFSYLNLEEGKQYRLRIRSGTGSHIYLTYTFKTLGESGDAITITENPSVTEIKSDSIKLGITAINGNMVHGLVTLQAQIGYKPIGSAPFTILQTIDKDISGLTSTPTFEFPLLNQGTDYTIKILNKTINKLTTFSKDYKTLGIKKTIPKAYVNGKLTVGDTTAIIKYLVITEGETKNVALKYSTTNSDLLVTVYPAVGAYQEQSVMGTDLNPANATFNLIGLTPNKLYDFWVIDTSIAGETSNEISIKNSFHTLEAGAQPYDVYAGIAEGACPEGEYCYLAPLGDKTSIDTSNKSIADYLSYIFKFGIGLAGVLAVVMLIWAGIQYMGSDSFFSKEEAKGSITNALIGLLIALASYLILNTLNPELVNLKLNIGAQNITEDIMLSNDPTPPDGTPVGSCFQGITNVLTTGGLFPACKTISNDLKAMIDLAWSQGYKISGYGFRNKEKQIKLREKNCGTGQYNVYEKPAGECKPPTAIPGTSMHESGLAFDLQCDGVTIRDRTNRCYVWLKDNAKSVPLKNLPSEPWHWSTTGK